MIYVENKKRKLERLQTQYPSAVILDITSSSDKMYAQLLSPFYPHYNIPIPFTEGLTASCVEGVWQGLKVFQNEDVSLNSFKNDTMKNLKRTVRTHGMPLGHRKGVYGTEILSYFDARMLIYLPTYKWVLDNVERVHNVVERIKSQSEIQDIVLLDYNTNIDVRDVSKPISHAGLVKLYIEGNYPSYDQGLVPYSVSELEAIKASKKTSKKSSKKNSNNNQNTLF